MNLLLVALAYLILLRLLRRFLFPVKEYKELMERLKETNKAFLKAAKEGNTEEMERINRERIALMQGPYVKVMGKQIPYMLGVVALLIPFKWFVETHFPPDVALHLPFTIPILNLQVIQGPLGVFFFYVILLSLLFSIGQRVWKAAQSLKTPKG